MISFIIPAYNCENVIHNSLSSIVNQVTDYDYEIIIINDGSTDNTLKYLNEFSSLHDNVIIKTIANSGPGLARNEGIKLASMDYIWFVDADDYLMENVFNDVCEKLDREQPDIFIFSALEKTEDGKEKVWNYCSRELSCTVYQNPSLFLKQQWPWNKIIRRDFLINTDIVFDNKWIFEDIYFFCKLYFVADKIHISRDVNYVYAKNGNSITSQFGGFISYPKALLYEFGCFIKAFFKKV